LETNNLFSLENKIAVVTGGMGQLGMVYAKALAAAGARVAVFDTAETPRIEDPEFENRRKKQQILAFPVDITDKLSLGRSLEALVEEWGVPHVLINNAAIDSPPDAPPEENGPFESYPEASFDAVMDVNVKGTLFCCQQIGGKMAAEGRGAIVNIASVYGILSPRQDVYEFRRQKGETFYKPAAYSVSKSAILNLTRYLATYWASRGVRVNTLTLHGVFNNQPQGFLDAYCPHVPMQRMAAADEMIGPILFLVSDASSYMTGANLVVDGGWSAW
jgi:NAD(P)-dependent dehydrogenase (short-subunit alcohol dehydrogenase family)